MAKRQATKKGVAFTVLDNGFAAADDPARPQAISDRLGPDQIDALLRKWLRRLPHPFTRDDYAAGYRYEISIRLRTKRRAAIVTRTLLAFAMTSTTGAPRRRVACSESSTRGAGI
jgi:hypothetical protein